MEKLTNGALVTPTHVEVLPSNIFAYLVPLSRHSSTIAVTVGHRWKECLQLQWDTENRIPINLYDFLDV